MLHVYRISATIFQQGKEPVSFEKSIFLKKIFILSGIFVLLLCFFQTSLPSVASADKIPERFTTGLNR
jgi:hypothetical protein